MSLNSLTLIGRLIDAPRAIPSKTPGVPPVGCAFRIASNHRYKTKSGEVKEEQLYLDCTAWGKKGEQISLLFKGAEIFVEGRLKSSKYTDKDGQERMKTELLVEEAIFSDKLSSELEFEEEVKARGGVITPWTPIINTSAPRPQFNPQPQRAAQRPPAPKVQQPVEDYEDSLPF